MTRHSDREAVAALLGRPVRGAFRVVVRHRDGTPVVIENAPLLDDGTPMPTRWWLVGEPERTWVGRLEAASGVARAEAAVDPGELAAAHARCAAERDAALPPGYQGPRPTGGVGGTRRGVKCLHAHYAWWLAGGDDPVGAWVARELAAQGHVADVEPTGDSEGDDGVVAAIDCGTNSTRLLVARRGPDGRLVTLRREMRITRLGQGVDATGRLDPAAVQRTLDVLRSYRTMMDDQGVGPVRLTATSAARDAMNRDTFFVPATDIVGVAPELLSGQAEAGLSFAGATAELADRPGRYLVVDVGGGSTEFAAGTVDVGGSAHPGDVESVDLGCVRVTERFLSSDPPTWRELAAARSHCVDVVTPVTARITRGDDPGTIVGLAGTVATLAAIDQGLAVYDRDRVHHHWLGADRVRELTGRLMRMDSATRAAVPGMETARVGVIVGGAIVVTAILDVLGADGLLTSEADILDGLAASLLDH